MSRRAAPGRLLALEGVDGSGKSTLQRGLAARLRRQGLRVGAWREPVDPVRGRRAQALGPDDPLGAAAEFTMDRLLGRSKLEALLRRTDLVITDRSFYSTLAYQGSALPPSTRRALAHLQRTAAIEPDRVVYLELPVRLALERVGGRGSVRAPLERARILRRVGRAYRGMARGRTWWVLDARAPPEALAAEAERRVLRWLGRRPASARRRG
jgi:dTMP kinase